MSKKATTSSRKGKNTIIVIFIIIYKFHLFYYLFFRKINKSNFYVFKLNKEINQWKEVIRKENSSIRMSDKFTVNPKRCIF